MCECQISSRTPILSLDFSKITKFLNEKDIALSPIDDIENKTEFLLNTPKIESLSPNTYLISSTKSSIEPCEAIYSFINASSL